MGWKNAVVAGRSDDTNALATRPIELIYRARLLAEKVATLTTKHLSRDFTCKQSLFSRLGNHMVLLAVR